MSTTTMTNPDTSPREFTPREVTSREVADALCNPDLLLVIHRAIRKFGRTLDEDVCWSYAREAVWRALQFYNPDHPSPMKLTTAVFRFTRNRLMNRSQKEEVRRRHAHRHAHRHSKSYIEWNQPDAASQLEPVPGFPYSPNLQRLIELVPLGYRELLTRHYLDGVPLVDMAKQSGLSPDYLSEKMQVALFIAREAARREGITRDELYEE